MRKLLVVALAIAVCAILTTAIRGPGTSAGMTAQEPPTLVPVVYLPAILRGYAPPAPVQFSAYAANSWHLVASGSNLAGALTGQLQLPVWEDGRTAGVANMPPLSADPPAFYGIERSFVAFDLSGAPQGTILSAKLELYTNNAVQGVFDVTFHRGTCTQQPTTANWNSYAPQVLGTLNTAPLPPWSPDVPIWVDLPGLTGQAVPQQTIYLLLRGNEVTELPTGSPPLLAIFSLDRWVGGDWVPSARLHLVIQQSLRDGCGQ